jgi:photosystem II stability/assembly factor-like uncharacterized protein
MWRRMRIGALLALIVITLAAGRAAAHDPSRYGGVFRSRNMGANWLNSDVGLFLNAALIVAVDPRDPMHLMIGTDVGILASHNGGRSWHAEGKDLILGAVFALAFGRDGRSAMCAAPGGVFRAEDGTWSAASAPADAYPARAVLPAAGGGKVYLLGRSRLFASEDGGRSYQPVQTDLPFGAEFGAIAVASGPPELLLAAIGGHLMRSQDGGRHWQGGAAGLPAGALDTVTTDPYEPSRIWAAGADRVYRSEDLGRSWQAVGAALPEPHTMVRGIAADAAGTTIVLTTHRGMYRSEDAGSTWIFKEDNLPIHIEAGPLSREPGDPRVLLAVYSYMPYPEIWRSAIEGGNLLARLDPLAIAGGIAFILLLFVSGTWLALWLTRLRAARPQAGSATT